MINLSNWINNNYIQNSQQDTFIIPNNVIFPSSYETDLTLETNTYNLNLVKILMDHQGIVIKKMKIINLL